MGASPGLPPPPPPSLPPPPPPPARPEEIAQWRSETQATVAQVRHEVEAARVAGVRGYGWLWLGMGASLGAIDLVGAAQGYLGSNPGGWLLLGQLYLPAYFTILGLIQVLLPGRFPLLRRDRRRSLRRLFGDAAAESPLGSALAELEQLRKELGRSDSSDALAIVGSLLAIGGGFLLALFTVTSLQRAISTGAPPVVPTADLALAAVGAVVIAVSLRRILRSSREIRGLRRSLSRFEGRLWELQSAFWGRF